MAKKKIGEFKNTKEFKKGQQFEQYDEERRKIILREVTAREELEDGTILVFSKEVEK